MSDMELLNQLAVVSDYAYRAALPLAVRAINERIEAEIKGLPLDDQIAALEAVGMQWLPAWISH